MAKMSGSKKVKGDDYDEKSEKFQIKSLKKDRASKKIAGIGVALKKAQKDEGYSKKPKPKVARKGGGMIK